MKNTPSSSTGFLALIGIALHAAACGGNHESRGAQRTLEPAAVETVAVQLKKRPIVEQVVGTVRPKLQATVTPKLAGRILEINAVPGLRVDKGQVMAELAADELQASVERADAALQQAQREQNRYANLLQQKAVTRSEFDAVDARFRIAKASLDETRAMADYTTVTAPFAGIITRKFQEAGDMASPSQPMFEIEDSTRLQLVIDVAESLAGMLTIGENFNVDVGSAGAELQGTVAELSPSADALSRTFRVKLDLPPHPQLRSGQFGRAALPRGERAAILVPQSAVFQRGQMDYVFVARDGVARLRIVRTSSSEGEQTEILSGLSANEHVVSHPTATLQDGQTLER